MGPTLTQAEFASLKTKLTRAINSGDQQRICRTVDAALTIFEEKGYPDAWHRWQIAKQDAEWAIQRQPTERCSAMGKS